jgi:hypothetical protein
MPNWLTRSRNLKPKIFIRTNCADFSFLTTPNLCLTIRTFHSSGRNLTAMENLADENEFIEIYETPWKPIFEITISSLFAFSVAHFGLKLIETGHSGYGLILFIFILMLLAGYISELRSKYVTVTQRSIIVRSRRKAEHIALETVRTITTAPWGLILKTAHPNRPIYLPVPKPEQLAKAIEYAQTGGTTALPFVSRSDTKRFRPPLSRGRLSALLVLIILVAGYFAILISAARKEGALATENLSYAAERKRQAEEYKNTPEGRRARYCIRRYNPQLPTDAEIRAYVHAKEFISQRLKAPSTATWPSMMEPTVSALHTFVECGFKVVGFVDSQNAFGAMIRSRYEVVLMYDPATDIFAVADFSVK